MTVSYKQKFIEGSKSLVLFNKHFRCNKESWLEPASFHYEWDKLLLYGKENINFMTFRESAKSFYIEGFNLHILSNPTKDLDFIVLVYSTDDRAKDKLRSIARQYQESPEISSNIVKILSADFDDGVFEVRVKNFETNEIIDVRICAYGKGNGSIRGSLEATRRPKLVILDDVQNSNEMRSEIQFENDWNWFASDILMLGDKTRFFIIGNNLGEKCIVQRIHDVGKTLEKLKFKSYVIPILDEYGKSVWEAKYPTETILKERSDYEKLGQLDVWLRERMCMHINPDVQIFKKHYFKKYYDETEMAKKFKEMNTYIAVDLATSEKKHADFTAMAVVSVNKNNHWFVREIAYGRLSTIEKIDTLFELVSKYQKDNLRLVGIEQGALKSAIDEEISRNMQIKNLWFTVAELKHERKKETRIESLSPRMKEGTVWFPRGAASYPWMQEFLKQAYSFPNGKRDDLLDALAYIGQLAIAPNTGTDEEEGADGDNPIAGAL